MTMERLYAPWRINYVKSSKKRQEGCVFCNMISEIAEHDTENYILYRAPTTFAVMNIYPYNTGHLMVLPKEHVSTLTELSQIVQCEMMTMITYFTEILTNTMRPDGFNIGLNLGQAAGAGIDGHLHMHAVPRWSGDSNFMPVTGNTRVLPQILDDTYQQLRKAIQAEPPKILRISQTSQSTNP